MGKKESELWYAAIDQGLIKPEGSWFDVFLPTPEQVNRGVPRDVMSIPDPLERMGEANRCWRVDALCVTQELYSIVEIKTQASRGVGVQLLDYKKQFESLYPEKKLAQLVVIIPDTLRLYVEAYLTNQAKLIMVKTKG